jgi:phosphate-selective porin OprO/OprP
VHLGGRFLLDGGLVYQSSGLERASFTGTDFVVKVRQARLLAEGTLYERLIFRANYDFASGDPSFGDLYVGMTGFGTLKAGTLWLGHVKEPFSFEKQMSRKYMTFMERSLANALAPDVRNTGIRAMDLLLDGRLRWAAGAFVQADDLGAGSTDTSGGNLTLRVTGLPLREQGDRRLLHLGMAFSHQFRDGKDVDFGTPPESFLADTLLQTPDIPANGVDILGVELAMVLGPLSLETEYLYDVVDAADGPNLRFHGGYAQVAWFLTGERRAYDLRFGHFGRIVPKHIFDPSRGDWGAWMTAARISHVDLDDRDVRGGTGTNVTAALSWFPFPIARVSTEYVYGHVNGQGNVHVGQMRFQVEF